VTKFNNSRRISGLISRQPHALGQDWQLLLATAALRSNYFFSEFKNIFFQKTKLFFFQNSKLFFFQKTTFFQNSKKYFSRKRNVTKNRNYIFLKFNIRFFQKTKLFFFQNSKIFFSEIEITLLNYVTFRMWAMIYCQSAIM